MPPTPWNAVICFKRRDSSGFIFGEHTRIKRFNRAECVAWLVFLYDPNNGEKNVAYKMLTLITSLTRKLRFTSACAWVPNLSVHFPYHTFSLYVSSFLSKTPSKWHVIYVYLSYMRQTLQSCFCRKVHKFMFCVTIYPHFRSLLCRVSWHGNTKSLKSSLSPASTGRRDLTSGKPWSLPVFEYYGTNGSVNRRQVDPHYEGQLRACDKGFIDFVDIHALAKYQNVTEYSCKIVPLEATLTEVWRAELL